MYKYEDKPKKIFTELFLLIELKLLSLSLLISNLNVKIGCHILRISSKALLSYCKLLVISRDSGLGIINYTTLWPKKKKKKRNKSKTPVHELAMTFQLHTTNTWGTTLYVSTMLLRLLLQSLEQFGSLDTKPF